MLRILSSAYLPFIGLWWSVEIFGPFLNWVICLIELYIEDNSPFLFVFFFLAFSRAVPVAYGYSQARGLIGAVGTDWPTPEPQQFRI